MPPEGLAEESIVHCRHKGCHDQHRDACIVKAPHHLCYVPLAAAQQVAHAAGQQAHAGAGKVHVDLHSAQQTAHVTHMGRSSQRPRREGQSALEARPAAASGKVKPYDTPTAAPLLDARHGTWTAASNPLLRPTPDKPQRA